MTQTAFERAVEALTDERERWVQIVSPAPARICREDDDGSYSIVIPVTDDGPDFEEIANRACVRAVLEAIREPDAEIMANVMPLTQEASPADYEVARKTLDLLEPVDHPLAADVVAELSRDWKAYIDHLLKDPSA